MDRSWAAVVSAQAHPTTAAARDPVKAAHCAAPALTPSAAELARRDIYSGLTQRVVEELRARGVDVETVLLSDRAVDETLRDLGLLVAVFSAFVAGKPGAALLSIIKGDWERKTGEWTSPNASRGALFKHDGTVWKGTLDTSSLTVDEETYENVTLRLPTDGCLMRSDADAAGRGEIMPGPARLHHHSRAFYEMTPLGATVLAPICTYMLHLLGAAPGEADIDLEVLYCGSEDRLDCKCVDRRAAPALVRTVQVSFEPGWPAAPVPPNHPGPWTVLLPAAASGAVVAAPGGVDGGAGTGSRNA